MGQKLVKYVRHAIQLSAITWALFAAAVVGGCYGDGADELQILNDLEEPLHFEALLVPRGSNNTVASDDNLPLLGPSDAVSPLGVFTVSILETKRSARSDVLVIVKDVVGKEITRFIIRREMITTEIFRLSELQ